MKIAWSALAFLVLLPVAVRADNLSDAQAAGHIGESSTVCGTVSSITSSAVLPGRPTYLNFGQKYPNQDFTVVIWGNQRNAVDPDTLAGKQVCVTGSISGFKGKAEMYLQTPDQLKREKKP